MGSLRKSIWTVFQSMLWASLVLIAIAALLVPIWLKPELPGQWCVEGISFIVCYRNWLASLSGWAAAFGAAALVLVGRQQVIQARNLANEQSEHHRRALLMSLVSKLENLALTCNWIIYDIDNYRSTNGIVGRHHDKLPVPPFAFETAELTSLPDNESQSLLRFGSKIIRINEEALELVSIENNPGAASDYIKLRAARTALVAIEWHDRLCVKIGWQPIEFNEERKQTLQEIIDVATEQAQSLFGDEPS